MRDIKFFITLYYQHGAIYEKDTRQLITHGCRKSDGLLFYDEHNFVAIIGSKSRSAKYYFRETGC